MKRMISDNLVVKIKKLIIEGYSTKSIKEIMMINHELTIDSGTISNIKLGKTYYEIRPDLNDLIKNKLSISKKIDTQKVSDIKWSLTCDDFSENEIIKVYSISDKILREIKLGYSPYCLISPEFNQILEKKYHRKKCNNIDDITVIDIKKQYVNSDGNILLSELASKHKIDKATVSTILSLKSYNDVGKSFHSKIIAIKNEVV
jgi:hypothetical protein